MLSVVFFLLGTAGTEFDVLWDFPLEPHDIYARGPVAVGRNTICVVDAKQRQLLFVDVQSQATQRIGRRGEGPGEFQFIGDVDWSESQQAFFVWDSLRQTMTRYSETGHFEETFTLTQRPDGFNMANGLSLFFLHDNTGIQGSQPSVVLADLNDTGTAQTVWHMEPLPQPVGLHRSDAELTVSLRFEWDAGLIIGGTSQTTAFMYSGNPLVYLIDHQDPGKVTSIPISIKRIPFRDEDVERRFSGPASAFRQKIEPHLVRPEFWPYAAQLFMGAPDEVWVISPSPPRNLGAHYVTYRTDGTELDSGHCPFNPKDIKGKLIYWIAADSQEDLILQQVQMQ